METFDMCVFQISSQDVKFGGCSWHVINTFFFSLLLDSFIQIWRLFSTFVWLIGHLTTVFHFHLWQKQWLFSTFVWAFVCMYVPGLRRLWLQDLKSQSKSRKLFLVWTVWVGYLAEENQNRKKRKIKHTRVWKPAVPIENRGKFRYRQVPERHDRAN